MIELKMKIGDRNTEAINALGVDKGREVIRNRNRVLRDKKLSKGKEVNKREN